MDDELLQDAREELRGRFGIGHATIQVEHGGTAHGCALAPEHIV